MTYIKKKRAREIYLANRELLRCAGYKTKIVSGFTPPPMETGWTVPNGPVWAIT